MDREKRKIIKRKNKKRNELIDWYSLLNIYREMSILKRVGRHKHSITEGIRLDTCKGAQTRHDTEKEKNGKRKMLIYIARTDEERMKKKALS